MAEIKFCGLTRAEDAEQAAVLGAAYAGVIFAGGPRLLDPQRAEEVFGGLGRSGVQRVGVFGAQEVDEIVRIANAVSLHVVQLHDGATLDRLISLRQQWHGAIWAVVGVSGATLPALPEDIAPIVDGWVLDTVVGGRSGGTGVAFDWSAVSPAVRSYRGSGIVVLAGGLRSATVADAVRIIEPDVVDVSSGVESAPGIKDPELMRAFAVKARPPEE